MPDSKSNLASSMSASLASAPSSLEGVADLALCPPPRLDLLCPLDELLDLALELDLDRDTDRDLVLYPEHDLDPECDLDLLNSPSSLSAIDC